MYKNSSYKEKFADLQEWIPYLIESVKKDLKNEHLKKDFYFIKKFLNSKNIHKVTTDELAEAYQKAIQQEENGEEIAEFITARWLIKNGELYEFFEQQLNGITSDFTSLEELSSSQAQPLIEAAVQQFGALQTYLFAVLNSVVFPQESFQYLKNQAQQDRQKRIEQLESALKQTTLDEMQKAFEREIARLTDKYEKKLAGLQKKYITDVENLKKQVAQLQRKMQEKVSA